MLIPNSELERYLTELIGRDALSQIGEEPTAIRINTLKTDRQSVCRQLREFGMTFQHHPFNPDGLILDDDFVPLSHTLLYFTGAIHYQGVSSQIPVLVLDPQPGETILDLAAAPGSKSTQIAAAMQNRGRLVVNDVSELRLQTLKANISSAGAINCSSYCLPGGRFGRWMPEVFDRVLVDAPCSNLGKSGAQLQRTRKWRPEILEHQSNQQYQLLVSALKTVRVGGVLVYSTCSIAPEENERVIDRLLQNYPHQVAIENIPLPTGKVLRPGLTVYRETELHPDMANSYRIYPFPQPMESFYIARLRKLEPLAVRPHNEPLNELLMQTPDEPEVSRILDELNRIWGIERHYLDNFVYHVTQKTLWLAIPDWRTALQTGLSSIGLPIALRKSLGWRLSNAGVQFFRHHISERIMELEVDDLVALFKNGKIEKWDQKPSGYYALRCKDELIATVANFNDTLKIRLPHSFNLVL
ncbi:MAG TPA: RsmB/NOP family class I SAM-dependent RNA methyltransferase [bacterium]|nr:RsmB/NOP family class I SAM-dependent RNA methyltransferase [bacterium]HOX84886.1 RsmB/NOP family class I SAM-dependent RNA methyltransferase [bacterium]HPG44248.1 RsmB/NOP family class I SAM-dependent RNA methyltransferase [bacterium]HPM96615.1 RsmB/NOP family class I SAM-dependent RNA methyltransferase [bacterium]